MNIFIERINSLKMAKRRSLKVIDKMTSKQGEQQKKTKNDAKIMKEESQRVGGKRAECRKIFSTVNSGYLEIKNSKTIIPIEKSRCQNRNPIYLKQANKHIMMCLSMRTYQPLLTNLNAIFNVETTLYLLPEMPNLTASFLSGIFSFHFYAIE